MVNLYFHLQLMTEAARNIIKSQYLRDFEEFFFDSTGQERRGLELVQEICRTKGRERLFEERKTETQSYKSASLSKMDTLNRTAQMFRTGQLTTSYQTTFGHIPKKNVAQTIFKFKNVSETQYAKLLTEPAQLFIDSWIQLKDKAIFQQDVLAFLRGVYAKLQNKLPPSTQMKSKYDRRTDWSLSQPIRMDKIGSDIPVWKPNLKAIQKQKLKEQKLKKKLQQLENSEFARQLQIFKQFKIN